MRAQDVLAATKRERPIFMTIRHSMIAAGCLGAIGTASAEDTYDAGKARKMLASASSFAELDRNGDRRISRSEAGFDRVMSQTFAVIDTGGDGFVSSARMCRGRKKPDHDLRQTVRSIDPPAHRAGSPPS